MVDLSAPSRRTDLGVRRAFRSQTSSFEGNFAHDDDTLAHLDSFMKGRPSFLLSKPPFESHGAAQPRSQQQPPCFLCEEWKQMIQRSRGSVAGSLDEVVPD